MEHHLCFRVLQCLLPVYLQFHVPFERGVEEFEFLGDRPVLADRLDARAEHVVHQFLLGDVDDALQVGGVLRHDVVGDFGLQQVLVVGDALQPAFEERDVEV